MNFMMNILSKVTHAALITFLVSVVPVTVAAAEGQSETIRGAAALEFEASVASVDLQTREVGLIGDLGLRFTLFVPKSLNLDDVNVGDHVKGTYNAAIETDLRAPTAEELADPWKVIEEGAKTEGEGQDSVGAARVVRAVVTVSIIAKERGIIAVTDSRDMMHFLYSVEPQKFTGLTDGQKVVVIFTEAMALTLEKKS